MGANNGFAMRRLIGALVADYWPMKAEPVRLPAEGVNAAITNALARKDLVARRSK